MRAALVLLAIAACGDDEVGTPTKSGTRLALEWYQTDDGSRAPDGTIYDRERDETCGLVSWNDGVYRCVNAPGSVVFADAACKQPLAFGNPNQLAAQYDPDFCSVSAVYQIAGPVSAQQYYSLTQMGCTGPYTSNGLTSVGASLDRARFAEVDLTEPFGDGRLQQQDYVSADGLRLLYGVVDTTLATSCAPNDASCSPYSLSDQLFSDAACTQRVTSEYVNPCSPPPKYYAEADAKCSNRIRHYALGARFTQQLYVIDGTTMTCKASTANPMLQYFAVGAEVSPAAMRIAIADAPGHRLQTMYDAGAGIAVPSGRMFDTQLDIECAFSQAADGFVRCLPSGASYGAWYSDAGCTQSIHVVFEPADDPSCGPAPAAPTVALGYKTTGSDVRVVVGPYSGKLYTGSSTSCTEYMPIGTALYLAGDLADLTQFASATTLVDP